MCLRQCNTFSQHISAYVLFTSYLNSCNSDQDPGQILQVFTCWKPQGEISVGSRLEEQDPVLDVLGSPLARLVVVLQDDQLHRPNLQ